MPTERIAAMLKEAAEAAAGAPRRHFQRDFHEAALNLYRDLPRWEKIARSMAHAVTNMDVVIRPGDRLAGRAYHMAEMPVEVHDPDLRDGTLHQRLLDAFEGYDELCENRLVVSSGLGHITWFWDRIVRHGVSGLRKTVEEHLRLARDGEAEAFYSGVLILLDALLAWNDRHVQALEEAGMHELAALCRRVPLHGARSFHEAVQAFYMQHIVVMSENPYGGNGPGRLDYYLWPYLERDLREGVCTLEDARELIDELFIRIDERIHPIDGWVEAVVVGGTFPSGVSAVNPLSYMMVESIMELGLTHPSVYVRVPEDAPEAFLDLCARYFLSGSNRAQILSDPAILRAITDTGVPYRDAVEYACGGCMEVGMQGMTSDYLYVGYYNVPKLVELYTTGGECLRTGKMISAVCSAGLGAYEDFESFYRGFIDEFRRILRISHGALDICSASAGEYRPSYLVSSMIDDCVQRGRNMHEGGARYHDYGATPFGIPNAADYLYAIRRAVFEDKLCTAQELLCALRANFYGYEALQQKLRAIPKYGMEDAGADAMAARLLRDIGDAHASHRNRHGGRSKIVILTFVWAIEGAALLGATADGGNAGAKPFAHGLTPQSSSMSEGLTAAMNSCLSLPQQVCAGGASTMWDFDSGWASPEVVKAVLKTFLERGGQIFQGNATDVEELIRAQTDPDAYSNLIVRVGGFSAKFVTLGAELQNEIIARHRHKS